MDASESVNEKVYFDPSVQEIAVALTLMTHPNSNLKSKIITD